MQRCTDGYGIMQRCTDGHSIMQRCTDGHGTEDHVGLHHGSKHTSLHHCEVTQGMTRHGHLGKGQGAWTVAGIGEAAPWVKPWVANEGLRWHARGQRGIAPSHLE